MRYKSLFAEVSKAKENSQAMGLSQRKYFPKRKFCYFNLPKIPRPTYLSFLYLHRKLSIFKVFCSYSLCLITTASIKCPSKCQWYYCNNGATPLCHNTWSILLLSDCHYIYFMAMYYGCPFFNIPDHYLTTKLTKANRQILNNNGYFKWTQLCLLLMPVIQSLLPFLITTKW